MPEITNDPCTCRGAVAKAFIKRLAEEKRAAVPADLPRASERFELIRGDFQSAPIDHGSVCG